ncbi:preprotein translocase subunit SecG, partial [Methylobrevis pamukkalensis]|uniref:preprotein translocase subunit SecG n=1 Tax=Methylobrevis pamukkalensis TaxID=1439726 RepID=UPI0009F7140D
MQTVILVIHLMVVIALVGVVLIQRSEGGALGIGGGGGGGFMSSRGSANVLTRATAILAAIFFVTSLALTVLPRVMGTSGSILDTVAPAPAGNGALPDLSGSGNGVLDQLNQMRRPGAEPGAQVPAAPEAP